LRVENDIRVQTDKGLSIQPLLSEPEGVNVIGFGERRIFYEAEPVTVIRVILDDMPDDLILFISHDNPDIRHSYRKQALNLMIENRRLAAVELDQTFRVVSMNRVDSCSTSRCKNECLHDSILKLLFGCR
jgi:hypothetical protein